MTPSSKRPSFVTTPPAKRAASSAAPSPSGLPASFVECPLVQRVPKAPRGGDSVEQVRREAERNNFCEILNILWNQPDIIPDCLGFCRKAMDKAASTPAKTTGPWSPPTVVGKVNKDWLVSWLVKITQGRLTADWCDHMDCKDPTFLHELASLLLQMPLQLPIPQHVREDQEALTQLFDARVQQLGRIGHVVASANIKGKSYNKLTGGAYSLTWAEGRATQVRHISGAISPIGAHISIAQDFEMLAWYSDVNCVLKKEQAEYFMHKFFEANTGPHVYVIKPGAFGKLCNEYRKAAVARVEAAQAAEVAAAEAAEQIRPNSKHQRSEAVAQQAKAALEKFREVRAKRARITLG